MPINLAQTALTAIKLGETALTAIYDGITRVYPNEVTVSIDGPSASTQTGSPGTSMTAFSWSGFSPGSNQGWTSSNISSATITGLPTGWIGSFNATGSLGSQTGYWSIITTDGNLPLIDTNILVGSLTSNIATTSVGTLTVVFGDVNSYGIGGTRSGTAFFGETVSLGISAANVAGTTPVGTLLTVGSFSQSSTGGINASYGPSAGQQAGVLLGGQITQSASKVISQTTHSGTTTCTGAMSNYPATPVGSSLSNPPWSTSSQQGQAFWYNFVPAAPSAGIYPDADSRVRTRLKWDFTGGTIASPIINTASQPPQTNSSSIIFIKQFFNQNQVTTGTYTVTIQSNVGNANNNQQATWITVQSGSANWYAP